MSQFTVDEIVRLIAALTPQERGRLLRLIVNPPSDESLYRALPPAKEEFSTDHVPLPWEGEDWETVGCL